MFGWAPDRANAVTTVQPNVNLVKLPDNGVFFNPDSQDSNVLLRTGTRTDADRECSDCGPSGAVVCLRTDTETHMRPDVFRRRDRTARTNRSSGAVRLVIYV